MDIRDLSQEAERTAPTFGSSAKVRTLAELLERPTLPTD
jgi:hypothetical protein